jgi:hypothetical protein
MRPAGTETSGSPARNRGHDEAIDLIGRALTRSPFPAAMHSNLGNALLASHRFGWR